MNPNAPHPNITQPAAATSRKGMDGGLKRFSRVYQSESIKTPRMIVNLCPILSLNFIASVHAIKPVLEEFLESGTVQNQMLPCPALFFTLS